MDLIEIAQRSCVIYTILLPICKAVAVCNAIEILDINRNLSSSTQFLTISKIVFISGLERSQCMVNMGRCLSGNLIFTLSNHHIGMVPQLGVLYVLFAIENSGDFLRKVQ
jgi:hypothetical protein